MASEARVLPRWSALKPMVRRFSVITAQSLVMIACVASAILITDRRGITAREYFLFTPLVLGCAVAALAFPLWALVREWFKWRSSLLESETYLVLFTAALCLSTWFGLANYTLYFLDSSSFNADKQLEQVFAESQEREWQQHLTDSARVVRTCEEIVRLLQQEPGEVLQLSKVTHDLYRTDLKGSDVEISYILFPNWDKFPPPKIPPGIVSYVQSLSAKAGTETISFRLMKGDLDEPYGKYIFHPEIGIPKSLLIATFREKAKWEYDAWVSPMKSGITRRPIPLSLFLYQAVMDTIGASPKYFSPATFASRLLALVYALCKFVFFGMLVAALMKQFKPIKPDEAKEVHA
ncbi:MAG: hypothetical protein LAO78_24350 [Acidobacteriia bacterium]|nr:hypothetical protein [Terriglobia bacterium]